MKNRHPMEKIWFVGSEYTFYNRRNTVDKQRVNKKLECKHLKCECSELKTCKCSEENKIQNTGANRVRLKIQAQI